VCVLNDDVQLVQLIDEQLSHLLIEAAPEVVWNVHAPCRLPSLGSRVHLNSYLTSDERSDVRQLRIVRELRVLFCRQAAIANGLELLTAEQLGRSVHVAAAQVDQTDMLCK
jgi:hypothetical protein